MNASGKEDLRVQRTKEIIRRTFTEMICEMDYEQITIKELTERARINRKTFYLHYNGMDDLLREMQNEMAQEFIQRTQNLERPRDMDKITREFFLRSEELGKFGERLLCCGNYNVGKGQGAPRDRPLRSQYPESLRRSEHNRNLQTVGRGRKEDPPGTNDRIDDQPDLQRHPFARSLIFEGILPPNE